MKTIRTFLAIPLPSSIADEAIDWVHEMRPGSDSPKPLSVWKPPSTSKPKPSIASSPGGETSMGIKWVPEDNLHLTLKFLGEVENVEVPQICKVLSSICQDYEPFELLFGGTGFLPDLARARILTVQVEDPTRLLTKLVQTLEDRFADLGFKREPRDYVPHLTLGRVRSGSRRASDNVIEKWQKHEQDVIGAMTVDHIQVIGSFLEKRGPTYNVMQTVDL